MNKGRIIIIRHGQTAWNKQRYTGWEDIALDHTGRQQAEDIAVRLRAEPIDAIYSSSLIRAVETIRPLAEKLGLQIKVSDNLKELHYGQWQGTLKSEHQVRTRKYYKYDTIPGGESLYNIYQRVKQFKESIKEDFVEGHYLLIVGHSASNRMLLGVICQMSFLDIVNQLKFRPRNGSLFEINYVVDSEEEIQILSSSFID